MLIVDDAAFMRHVLSDILSSLGCDVVGEAGDGEEACEKCRTLRPDLVMLDMTLPKKGGLETLKAIRGRNPEAKVIVISANDRRQPLMEALKLGAVDTVTKPFERQRVEETVNRVTAGQPARDRLRLKPARV